MKAVSGEPGRIDSITLNPAGIPGGNQAPEVVLTIGDVVLDQDAPLEEQAFFTDPDGDDAALTYSLAPGGAALGLDRSRQRRTDRHADQRGRRRSHLRGGRHGRGRRTATDPVTVTVNNVNDAPGLGDAVLANQVALQGQLFTYALPADTFTDIDLDVAGSGDTLSYSATLEERRRHCRIGFRSTDRPASFPARRTATSISRW